MERGHDMFTSEELESRLWEGANELRGSMDASRYKDYMLGLMFYKFLSEKTLAAFQQMTKTSATGKELLNAYQTMWDARGEQLKSRFLKDPGYYILPGDLYDKWMEDIGNGTFELQNVIDAFSNFDRMIQNSANKDDFEDLFSTMDLTDSALGPNLNARSKNISKLIQIFSDFSITDHQKNDIIGDAYEYLIGQFAMESGKKAGEFYTPHQVSDVIARIVTHSVPELTSIYDPCVGSGSLLLTVKYYLDEEKKRTLHYYGQEKNTATYNLTRMNLMLHDVKPAMMDIKNADTLEDDWPEDPTRKDEGRLFDAVVMNPPYSLKNWNTKPLTVSDPRFEMAGVLPPDNKGDYAFLLHGLYHLGPDGTMAIVLPHGVLFRGAAEGTIRERLIEHNVIDTIIGLPDKLFTNTGIPVIILVLKKNRPLGAPILFIDAAKGFVKSGKNNRLRERDIAKIVDTYLDRHEEKGYSHLAPLSEIKDNGCNLNIPRYVERLDDDIPHDVDGHLLGGIPEKNIAAQRVLQAVVPEHVAAAFHEVRPGYVGMTATLEDLRENVLQDARVTREADKLRGEVDAYIGEYWEQFKSIRAEGAHPNIVRLHSTMLQQIKDILAGHPFLDIYSGYQIIADLWASSLTNDLEIITGEGFYEAAKLVEKHMVEKTVKGKKEEVQDGWDGRVIPNEIVAEVLYADRLADLHHAEEAQQEAKAALAAWAEKAADESTPEGDLLGSLLKEDKSGFDTKQFNAAVKQAAKGSADAKMLQEVKQAMSAVTAANRAVTDKKKALKTAVESRYPTFTNAEIDKMLWRKWFDRITDRIVHLVREPLDRELDTIAMLCERYAQTLDEIDGAISEQEAAFEAMQAELVVTEG